MSAFFASLNTGSSASAKSGYVTIALTCWAIIARKSASAWFGFEWALR